MFPTIVLAEFYAQTYKRTGREVADKCFRGIVISGLDISPLTQETSYHAGLLRAKYKEKLPWGTASSPRQLFGAKQMWL